MPVICIMLCSVKHLFLFQRDDDDMSDSTLTDSVLDDEGGAVMPSQRVCLHLSEVSLMIHIHGQNPMYGSRRLSYVDTFSTTPVYSDFSVKYLSA